WRPPRGVCCRRPRSCTNWCRDSGSRDAASPARLLLAGGFLFRGRLGPGGAAGGPALERALDVGEDAVAFLRPDQAATHRVANQLLGVIDGELAQSGGPADRLDQGV